MHCTCTVQSARLICSRLVSLFATDPKSHVLLYAACCVPTQQALGAALCTDGYDSINLLYGLSPAELQSYGFKPGHLRRLELTKPKPAQLQAHEAEPGPTPPGGGSGPGTEAWTHADSLLQNTWVKRDAHEFLKLLSVEEVDNRTLGHRYDKYKLSLRSLDGSTLLDGNEQLVFHGCAADAIPSILANGFQRKFWKSAAGDWQRFGPGFYFALQVSETELANYNDDYFVAWVALLQALASWFCACVLLVGIQEP
jgi:hypothetical protein